MKKLFTNLCGRAIKIALVVCALVIGGGNAAWGQKTLPYSYGFENNNLVGEGWTLSSTQSMSSIQTTGTIGFVSKTGSYSFRFYNKQSEDQYLITPELANSDSRIEFYFYYNNNGTGSSSIESFSVGYSTTTNETTAFTWGDEITSNDTEWHKFEESYSSGVKYLAIKYSSASKYRLYIDDINIEIAETYKRPKNLIVSSFTTSSATLSWTAGSNETEWQIAYSTKEDFDPDTEGIKVSVTENPYTINGLVDGVTYYVYVRSNYNGNFSAWSNKVEMIPLLVETVNANGTNTNASIPIIDRTYSDSYMQTQFIIPASDTNLANIQNTTITKLTFYCSQNSINWNGATFEVYMKEVDKTIYNSPNLDTEWGTKVFNSGVLSVSNGKMAIELDTPFPYTTGNLMIGFKQTHISGAENNTTSISSNWYGTTQASYSDYTGIYYGMGYSSVSTSRTNFIPKATFTTISSAVSATLGTNGYTTFACPRPLDLANLPSGLKAYKAAVEGTTVKFTEINQTVPANTGMLLEGAAGETYRIPVAASGTAPDGNAFLVNSTGGTFTAETGYSYFGLMKDSGAPLVFGVFKPGTVAIPTNKAYLKVADTTLSRLTCVFGDDTEGIQGVEQKALNSEVYYNLAGLKVEKPSKGLYIVNGKKVVIK